MNQFHLSLYYLGRSTLIKMRWNMTKQLIIEMQYKILIIKGLNLKDRSQILMIMMKVK